ncbi:hypothetical protein QJS04_geneDACA007561 [Acorus gramineus]|uniref:Cell division control protein n=1 Tax=Acorus gramineus TaxID=55184 RepID=A0AAV9B383_ACOGR|nr:hypothetical protein QJS04_geneDACA007561 [Acorus gramineus]
MKSVKEALHVSMSPSAIVCREEEQKRLLEFCKSCVEQEKAGSMYVCGCPGTGKTLSMERVKELLVTWANEVTFTIFLDDMSNFCGFFFSILEKCHLQKKINGTCSPFQQLQDLFSQNKQSYSGKMMLIVVDEMDYLITRDHAVLHDLFMLTTLPLSRCILIGIANAIDLAERFLPKLHSLNCKPRIITFRAVRFDHMAMALSKAFKSPVVETIQSLPQHQQIILCTAAKCYQQGKKEMTVAELNKAYSDTCKSALVPAVGMLEFSNMCRVLGDQVSYRHSIEHLKISLKNFVYRCFSAIKNDLNFS